MINPNQNTSEDVLRRFKEASYERMRVELKCSVELKLKDFEMTWDDLAKKLERGTMGQEVKEILIGHPELNLADLNDIAHIFSCELYIIFRPRNPWVAT